MEDLGLLQISDRKIHEDSKSVDDDKGEVFCSNVSKALDNRDSVVKKPQACSRPPPTFNSKEPAWEEHLCSGDITSGWPSCNSVRMVCLKEGGIIKQFAGPS